LPEEWANTTMHVTSPTTVTAKDDGYLSGSEIAALKIDAEWVSCNLVIGIEAD